MFNYYRNKLKTLFRKNIDPSIYNGTVWSIQNMKTKESFYFLIKHSYLNMHRKEPLSFVGVKVNQEACDSEVLSKFISIKKDLVNIQEYNFKTCQKDDMKMPALRELITLKKSVEGVLK